MTDHSGEKGLVGKPWRCGDTTCTLTGAHHHLPDPHRNENQPPRRRVYTEVEYRVLCDWRARLDADEAELSVCPGPGCPPESLACAREYGSPCPLMAAEAGSRDGSDV